MEIWLIQNGVRTGPFAPYDIEGRLTRDELSADQPAWHDGMPSWGTLGDMPQFAGVLARRGEHEAEVTRLRSVPPPLPPQPLLLRRFFARWLDFNIIHLLWWAGLALAQQDLTKIYLNPWMLLGPLLPWLLIEALLLRRLATTPGKFLLGLEVRNLDGSNLSLRQALLRTLRVLSLGLGLRLPILMLACQGMSAWLTWRYGASLWDLAPGHRVLPRPLVALRVAALSILLAVVIPLTGLILMPTFVKVHGDDYPWLRAAAAEQAKP
jgi:uncharacterized RDD family membrane protein YckC